MAKKSTSTPSEEIYFTIKEAAEQVGVVSATIRNWERQGLFVSKRTSGGYRIYSQSDIEWLKHVKQYSKDENMGIKAIRMLYGGTIDQDHVPREKTPTDVTKGKNQIARRLKQARLEGGYHIKDVARAIGISAPYLSKIENEQANASYKILQQLSDFYGQDFVTAKESDPPHFSVVRKNTGEIFVSEPYGITMEVLSGQARHTLEALLYTIEPGCGRPKAFAHHGEEFIYVLEGVITLVINGQEYVLQAGDSLNMASEEMHTWHNSGSAVARVLWMHTPLVRR